jgi:GT2 family glycosyltransferase
MEISIIIINFNTKELTRQCIQSIYDKTTQVTFEVIVIDNASADGSVEALSTLHHDNYHYIYNDKNTGFSRANNKASKKARGEYLFFMNSDMVLVNDVLSILSAHVKKNTNTGIAGPRFLNPDGSLQISCRNFPNIIFGCLKFFPFLKGIFSREAITYYQQDRDYSNMQEVDTVSAGAMLIKRSLFEEMGRFDEFSFMYGEDADICRQVRDKGYQVVFVPVAQLIHYGGQSSQLNSYRAVWAYYFAFYYLYKKYYFGRFGVVLKPIFGLRALVAIFANLFKRDKRVTWNDK